MLFMIRLVAVPDCLDRNDRHSQSHTHAHAFKTLTMRWYIGGEVIQQTSSN